MEKCVECNIEPVDDPDQRCNKCIEYRKEQETLGQALSEIREQLRNLKHDKCEFCLGIKGGALGNENVVDGVVVCDYCTVILMDMKKRSPEK